MLFNCCSQYASKSGKLSSGHKTEKGQFSFQSQRKAMPKECSNYGIIAFISHTSKVSSVQLSHSAMSDSLWPHGLQYARPPCPSPTPRVYSNSCPLSQWGIQPSHPLSAPSLPTFNLSQHQGLFKWVSSSHQVAKVLEFQLQHHWSPSNEYSGLIFFRMDSLDLLAVQGTLKSLLQHHTSRASILQH